MGFHADATTIQTIAGRLEAEELTSEQVRMVSERCGTAEQHPVQTCGGGARVQGQRHPPRGGGRTGGHDRVGPSSTPLEGPS